MDHEGTIHLDQAFAYRGLELWVNSKSGKQKLKVELVNHFAAEMDHFSECILKYQPPRTPGTERRTDMQIIAALQESAREGRVVRIPS